MQKISYEIAVVVQQLIAHIEEYQPTDHGTQEEWNAFAKKYPQSKNLSANRAS